jgi:pilus assembly protein CpaE
LPAAPIDLIEVVRRLCPRGQPDGSEGPQRPHVVAVTGAAGGVGCTSIAVNLATTIAKLSRRDTVLADFDLLLGSLEESLAIVPDNSLEVVARNLDEISPTLLKRWLPRHPSGLYVLPHPVSMEEAAGIEPATLARVLDLLVQSFSAVVIDTSKGLQQTDFLAFEAADVIVVVLQLNLNCTRNTVRLLQYLRQFEGFESKIRLAVNRLNSPLSEISVKKAEQLLKASVHWLIPNSTRLFRPARVQGVPIDEVEGGAGSKAHDVFLKIAQEILPLPVPAAKARRRLFTAFR